MPRSHCLAAQNQGRCWGPIMASQLRYRNLEQLAHAIHDVVVNSGFSNASPRPWNPFDSGRHFWWVMPTKEFPCYHTGKFYVCTENTDDWDVECGMEIERGFGRPVAAISSSAKEQRLVMDESWIWHSVLADMKSGKFQTAFQQAATQIGCPLRLNVLGHRYTSAEKDPYLRERPDTVVFDVSSEGIQPIRAELREGLLPASTAECKDFASLATCLDTLPDPDWTWIGIIITAPFEFAPAASDAIDAKQLYERLLTPFTPWFR